MAGPKTEKYTPKFSALAKEIGDRLTAAFGPLTDADRGGMRLEYVFIDGKPLRSYILDYQAKSRDFDVMSMEENDKRALAPEMILNALIHGQHVYWAIPEERTGAFLSDNVKKFEAPESLADFLKDEAEVHDMEQVLKGSVPIETGLSEFASDNLLTDTADLLEKRSSTDLPDYMREDFLRDVLADPLYNPQGAPGADPANGPSKTVQDLLNEINDPVFNFSVARATFVNHGICMLMNEGIAPERIFDEGPEGQALRARAGKKLYEICVNKNVEEMLKINIQGSQLIERLVEDGIRTVDYSNAEEILGEKNRMLYHLAKINFDLNQERGKHKEESYKVLAKFQGETITNDQQKTKFEEEYNRMTGVTYALKGLTDMVSARVSAMDVMLGFVTRDNYRATILPRIMESMVTQNLIIEGQTNGEPLTQKLSGKTLSEYDGINYILEGEDLPGKEIYKNLSLNASSQDRANFCESFLDGSFRKDHIITLQYDENNVGQPVIIENKEGYSSNLDHHPKERDFYSKEYTISVINDSDVPEADIPALNQALTKTLSDMFGITSSTGGCDRLFLLNRDRQLSAIGLLDLTDPEEMREIRNLLITGRLFVVKENENTPIQLGAEKVGSKWICSGTDCLDNDPKPVTYRWYHALGRVLGIQSCIDRKAALDRYQSKLTILDAVRTVSESRKKLQKLDTTAIEGEYENKLDIAARIGNRETAAKNAISNIYGLDPQINQRYIRANCYNLREFEALEKIDMTLEGGPALGTAPAVDKDGKIAFRNDDFVALAISAAATPELGGHSRGHSNDSKYIDPAIVADKCSTMYINDFAQESDPVDSTTYMPRPNVGPYIKNTVAPAREKAAEAIRAYQKGDNSKLAELIANGLAFMGRNYAGAAKEFSPTFRIVADYGSAYGDMLKADLKLEEAVRERFENIKANAAAAKEQNLAAKDAFRAENYEYMNTVQEGLKMLQANTRKFADKTPERQQAIEMEHAYFYGDNARAYELLQQDALFETRDKFLDLTASLSMDKIVERMASQKAAFDAIQKASEAVSELTTADIKNLPIDPERKLQLVKDIVRGQLIQAFDTQANLRETEKGDEAYLQVASVAKLFDPSLLPTQRTYDPKLFAEDQMRSEKLVSLNPICADIYQAREKINAESAVTKALTDPKNGAAALDEVFNTIYPDGAKFKEMQPKHILATAKNVNADVAKYQKALTEKIAKVKAAEKAAAVEKEAKEVVINK